MAITIQSLQNNRIKELVKLSRRRRRDERRVTLVEGVREASRALAAGIVPQEAYICPGLMTDEAARALGAELARLEAAGALRFFEVTPEVFAKIAYRGESGGVVLVIPYLSHTLEELAQRRPTFLAVIEGVEKPGNLGAILRTADAAGVDAVIVCAGATDIHNPNVVRASLGTLFTVPVVEASSEETITWLRQQGIRTVAATPAGEVPYTAVDMTGPVAVVLGSEAHGLSPAWLAAADRRVYIPMRGMADSLNLAISAALLLYEVVRQREGESE